MEALMAGYFQRGLGGGSFQDI